MQVVDMQNKSTSASLGAGELLSAKQKAKKSWAKLGISDEDAELIMTMRKAGDIKVTTPKTKAES